MMPNLIQYGLNQIYGLIRYISDIEMYSLIVIFKGLWITIRYVDADQIGILIEIESKAKLTQ